MLTTSRRRRSSTVACSGLSASGGQGKNPRSSVCGAGVLILFRRGKAETAPRKAVLPIPTHGAPWVRVMCAFRATPDEIAARNSHLQSAWRCHRKRMNLDWPKWRALAVFPRPRRATRSSCAQPKLWDSEMRALEKGKLLVASHNQRKINEMIDLLESVRL